MTGKQVGKPKKNRIRRKLTRKGHPRNKRENAEEFLFRQTVFLEKCWQTYRELSEIRETACSAMSLS